MQLKPAFDYQEGDFCRVYRCDNFQNLGPLQVVFLADKQPDEEGQDLPCLSVKTSVQGSILTANQFFQDSEDGENYRDKLLQQMDPKKAAAWVQKTCMGEMLSLFNESFGGSDDAA